MIRVRSIYYIFFEQRALFLMKGSQLTTNERLGNLDIGVIEEVPFYSTHPILSNNYVDLHTTLQQLEQDPLDSDIRDLELLSRIGKILYFYIFPLKVLCLCVCF